MLVYDLYFQTLQLLIHVPLFNILVGNHVDNICSNKIVIFDLITFII